MLLLLWLACVTPDDSAPPDSRSPDEDGDGVSAALDCDDSEPRVAPGLAEVCDGRDNNCDGQIDEDPTDGLALWADEDRDGYGDPAAPTTACAVQYATADNDGDCDDANPDANPGAPELPDNTLDDDCDGTVDETA